MLSENGKKIIFGEGTSEIIEKKSRFIATCLEVHSEEEALLKLDALKKKYWDARHNCHAYVIGKSSEIQRFSDDKEPQGTAGKPILDVLLSNDITNTLIVVTRYFGGILLGTGGLVRAYSTCASEGIKNSVISKVYDGEEIHVECDYNSSGKIEYLLREISNNFVVSISDTVYAENVTFKILTEEKAEKTLFDKITEVTSARAKIEKKGAVSFALKDGIPVLYSF